MKTGRICLPKLIIRHDDPVKASYEGHSLFYAPILPRQRTGLLRLVIISTFKESINLHVLTKQQDNQI